MFLKNIIKSNFDFKILILLNNKYKKYIYILILYSIKIIINIMLLNFIN
jgi:hypothetical protein